MQKQVTAQANELDLDYKLDQAIMTNTTTAHRLLHFAKEHGKMGEMKEKLLQAYFIEACLNPDIRLLPKHSPPIRKHPCHSFLNICVDLCRYI